jgi:IclR family acetate operon transcriptional repressor
MDPLAHIPTKTPPENAENPVKSAQHTIELMSYVKNNPGATITDLAEEFTLSQGAISNYINTLREKNIISKMESGGFAISLRFMDYYHSGIKTRNIIREGEPVVDDLADNHYGVVILMVQEQGYGYVAYSNSTSNIQPPEKLKHGSRRHLHCNPPGQSILAFMREEEVEKVMDEYGPTECDNCTLDCPLQMHPVDIETDITSLKTTLQHINEKGYSVSDHGQATVLGVPIFSTSDEVMGSLSLYSTKRHLHSGDEVQPSIIDDFKSGANQIGIHLTKNR